ncbi:asparagine synthase (glutamine-hydrolyzing) [delta proteobacterium NaphS2]|nr:asparagine synthase (glutamine-hydrolyzing) [delta proteobacterium NaphS2]
MSSASGRFVIVFNGEIYNHLELKQKLEEQGEAPVKGWKGHSDTEAMLAAIDAWGVEKALQSAVGMFAFALWDNQENTLVLVRDRVGEKPLYYGWQNGVFLFASELKALRKYPAFAGEVDREAVNLFFHFGYVPAPHSIYNGIFKLRPGCLLEINRNDIAARRLPAPRAYWSLESEALAGWNNPFPGDFQEASEELERLMLRAVKMQSLADVPVGAFLSGGIDSSLLVVLMLRATSAQVTTFSIGMPEERLNEAYYAREVAKHLGTDHVEHMIRPEEALKIIPRIPEIWDEPFADSSQIPTHLVCRLARKQVTVALSGDGGDEFFCGYSQYFLFKRLRSLHLLKRLPWETIFRMSAPFMKSGGSKRRLRNARAVVAAWKQPDGQALCRYWMDKFRQVPLPIEDSVWAPSDREIPVFPDVDATACLWDAAYYLPDDILVKVDRAAMAVSLETRAPFLDHRVVEFSLTLPPDYKLKGNTGKRILREVLYKYVPSPLVNRPKMGFSIPLSRWLKQELRPWAEEILTDRPALEEMGIDANGVKQLWGEHSSGYRDHTERIWIIVSLLLWKRS